MSACNPTINDKKGEEYVAAVNAKKGAGAFADLTGQIANSQFPDGVVTSAKIDSAYTSTLATKTYADSYMLGYALPAISTFTDNQTIRWRTATNSWEVFTPGAATGVNSLTVGSGLANGGTATDPSLSVSGVTSAMITDGTIVAADLASDAVTSAKILNGEIVAADMATGAVTTTQILDATIADADVSATAAIAGTKISPNFGAQNIVTTGSVTATSFSGDGSALTGLAVGSLPTVTVAKGGTGATTLTANGILLGNGTSPVSAATLTNGQVLVGSTGATPVAASLTGTNITVTPGAGSIGLSIPQSVATTASPTFVSLTLSGQTASLSMNSQKITNLATPTADTDAATKAYVDASSATVAPPALFSLTANNGLYNNQIPTLSTPPTVAYIAVCFKNGHMYADIHAANQAISGIPADGAAGAGCSDNGAAATVCGAAQCAAGDTGFIMERGENTAGIIDWHLARMECLKLGMRLQEAFEWKLACEYSASWSMSNITGNWEWGSNLASVFFTGGNGAAAASVFGSGDCTSAHYGIVGYVTTGSNNTYSFRCVR